MTREQRNATFEQYEGIIGWTVNRHWSFLKTLRMDADDLRQELALCLLKAIERYEPNRGAKESTFYFKTLRYGVLNLWRKQLREKRLADLYASPLVYSNKDGEEVIMALPFEVDFDMEVRINEFMRTLSPEERRALLRVVPGVGTEDKRHQRFMNIVRRKAMRYRLAGGVSYA